MKKILVIGGSTGMGRSIVKQYAAMGHLVSVTGRRIERLQALQAEVPAVRIYPFDVMDKNLLQELQQIVQDMNGLDLLIISAGGGEPSEQLLWELDEWMVQLNVNAFVAVAHWAYNYFIQQGHGQLAGISSIAAIRGNAPAPAYNAAKAFQSNYLEGLSLKAAKQKLPVYITCIEPGFVNTKPARDYKVFWLVPVEKAARQIIRGIGQRKQKVYISRRWQLIAWLLKIIPYRLYNKMVNR